MDMNETIVQITRVDLWKAFDALREYFDDKEWFEHIGREPFEDDDLEAQERHFNEPDDIHTLRNMADTLDGSDPDGVANDAMWGRTVIEATTITLEDRHLENEYAMFLMEKAKPTTAGPSR